MTVEVKLIDKGTIFQEEGRSVGNPAFHAFQFDVLPRVGELVLLHDYPGGFFIVVAVVHAQPQGESIHPIVLMEKWTNQKRQTILENYGWLPGKELGSSAFDVERVWIDN